MEWISVDDRLPECWSQHNENFASGYLLVYTKWGDFEIDQYWRLGKHTGKGWVLKSEAWGSNSKDVVTHWMPLPAPPTNPPPTDNNKLSREHAAEIHNR